MGNKIGFVFRFIVILAFAADGAWADITSSESVQFKAQSVSGSGCPGSYTGYGCMTNGAGTFWITPPTNTTSGTLTDISGFPSPYISVARVTCKSNLMKWCDTNSVNFPATNSMSYELYVYVKSAALTNGQPLTLQIVWH